MRSGNESNRITKRSSLPDSYSTLLQELKQRIQQSRSRASMSVNRELVLLYWHTGQNILVRQEREHWGAKVIDRLAVDLKKAFPEMKGFSPRNLKYMRAFAETWPDEEFVQAVLAQITWYHRWSWASALHSSPANIASKWVEVISLSIFSSIT